MRVCKTCKKKFDFKENIKSVFNRDGSIECENCKSVFALKKEGPIRWLLSFMVIFLVVSFSEKLGFLQGIILALVVGSIGVIINLNIDSLYVLKR